MLLGVCMSNVIVNFTYGSKILAWYDSDKFRMRAMGMNC